MQPYKIEHEIKLKTNNILFRDDDLGNCLQTFEGDIVLIELIPSDDTQEEPAFKETVIGNIEYWLINGNKALDNQIDIEIVMDSYDQDSLDYTSAIYKNGELIEDFIKFPATQNTLIAHMVEIKKDYQGNNYGLEAVKLLIDSYEGFCSAFLLQVAPLQFKRADNSEWLKKYNSSKFSSDESTAQTQLSNHWKKLGLIPTHLDGFYCKEI